MLTPPPRVDNPEPILVGDIVAAEDRPSPEERRFAHERFDGRALGGLARSDFEYELAFDDLPSWGSVLESSVQDIPASISQQRGKAVVQGNSVFLVFDENARMLRRERLQQRPDDGQVILRQGRAHDPADCRASFKPVQSGNRLDCSAQKAVDLLDGPAGYDRDCSAQRLAQRDQQRRQAVRHGDGLRGRRDIDDAAVEVEKQCPIPARYGQIPGVHSNHSPKIPRLATTTFLTSDPPESTDPGPRRCKAMAARLGQQQFGGCGGRAATIRQPWRPRPPRCRRSPAIRNTRS